jgi:hypothetical protein
MPEHFAALTPAAPANAGLMQGSGACRTATTKSLARPEAVCRPASPGRRVAPQALSPLPASLPPHAIQERPMCRLQTCRRPALTAGLLYDTLAWRPNASCRSCQRMNPFSSWGPCRHQRVTVEPQRMSKIEGRRREGCPCGQLWQQSGRDCACAAIPNPGKCMTFASFFVCTAGSL